MRRIAGLFLCVAAALAGQADPAAAVIVYSGPSGAQRCIYPTTYYTAETADAPPAIKRAIADSHGTVVFRTCEDGTGTRTYLRAPAPVRDGVCRFFEIEVVGARGHKHSDDAAAPVAWWNPPDGWQVGGPKGFETQPWLFMTLAAGGSCPRLDGLRYAHAENVSDGMFRTISQFTSALLRSLPALDAGLVPVPERERDSVGVGRLRMAVASGNAVRIDTISLIGAEGSVPGYEVWLSDGDSDFLLVMEMGDHGLEVRSASEPPVL